MKFKKPKFWNSINFLSVILLPFSLLTLVFNIFKSQVITENRFNIPTICVGNIFIGGTGKTPLSIYIYNLLKNKKFKPAIVRKYYPSHADEINFTKSKVRQFFSDRKRLESISKAIIKKKIIEENKITFQNNFEVLEDTLFFFHIIYKSKIKYIKKSLCSWRYRKNSHTFKNTEKLYKEKLYFKEKI